MRFRHAGSLGLAVAMVMTAIGPVAAANPEREAARLTNIVAQAADQSAAFAALSSREQQAVLNYTSLSYVTDWQSPVVRISGPTDGVQSAATTTCYDWTWGRDAHNPFGVLLWQFTQRIEWCANGTTITNTPFRTPHGSTNYLWWSYEGLVGDSTAGGQGQESYRSYVEGHMAYRPPYPWLNQDNYPWLDMTAHANGSGTGSGGG